MHLATHGYVEEAELPTEDDEMRRSIAAHEAGHAAMAILDSKGKNIPDYCSIVPGTDFKGVVTESLAYCASLGERTTYADFRHRIRIRLAGRAAEELAYGPESISTGAGGDFALGLQAGVHRVRSWGFAPDMTSHEQASGDLGVVLGDPTPTERARLEGQVRAYLAREYRHVYQVLEENSPLVDAIADRLMSAPIIDQKQLLELSRQHGCA